MKKLIAISILMLSSTASFATTYNCTAHFEGSTVGEPMKIEASKIAIAETKAKARLKKARIKVDFVECK